MMTPPPPSDFPARLLSRQVRVNGHGETSSTLAAFHFCGSLDESHFDSIIEAGPQHISVFIKRRGPARVRDQEEEKARVAQGFLVDITLIERRFLNPIGEITHELHFGSSVCHAQPLPFDLPDAWGVTSNVSQADLKRQCLSILEADALARSVSSARLSTSVAAPRL